MAKSTYGSGAPVLSQPTTPHAPLSTTVLSDHPLAPPVGRSGEETSHRQVSSSERLWQPQSLVPHPNGSHRRPLPPPESAATKEASLASSSARKRPRPMEKKHPISFLRWPTTLTRRPSDASRRGGHFSTSGSHRRPPTTPKMVVRSRSKNGEPHDY